jgi:hypothetical protein
MNTKIAMAVIGVVAVVGAALLAFGVYQLADVARWVCRRAVAVVDVFATFIVAACAIPTRARRPIRIKLRRR